MQKMRILFYGGSIIFRCAFLIKSCNKLRKQLSKNSVKLIVSISNNEPPETEVLFQVKYKIQNLYFFRENKIHEIKLHFIIIFKKFLNRNR